MSLSTPIAFLIFNRPDLTEIVFQAIAQARPKQLLVVADGSRFSEEAEKCNKTRDIVRQVDWDCEVFTNFSDTNLGCKKRISSGLDWVFSTVEEAIILEDDCLPHPSFFSFCQNLLEYYRFDTRVMHISGNNFQAGKSRTNSSYYFSKYSHIWGWASWRRAWQYFDVDLQFWAEFKRQNLLSQICEDPQEIRYWTKVFDQTAAGKIDNWDSQWLFACWAQSGLSILPNVNLVTNLGFRSDATHTVKNSPLSNLPIAEISHIQHPQFVIRNQIADAYTATHLFTGQRTLRNRIRQKLSQFVANFRP